MNDPRHPKQRPCGRKTIKKKARRNWPVPAAIAAVAGCLLWRNAAPPGSPPESATAVAPTAGNSIDSLLQLPASELESTDIARLNLACAVGLPGAEELDTAQCLTVLAQWTDRVRAETERSWKLYWARPGDFQHSAEVYRMTMLGTVLQQDCGVAYNPQRATAAGVFEPNNIFFADARDVFLHGLLSGNRRGTCSSLPVLYLAIGRRLGYPLKLVTAKAHLFLRWEAGATRFNIECTGRGVGIYDDDHYRQWPIPMTPDEERDGDYLRSLSTVETLAVFLNLRGHCLLAGGRNDAGYAAHWKAAQLAPESKACQRVLAGVQADRQPRPRPEPRWLAPAPRMQAPVLAVEPNPLQQLQNP